MRSTLKFFMILLSCFCLCSTALAQQERKPSPHPAPALSPADKAMMDEMSSHLMHFKVAMMGRKMMLMGVRMYCMGKMMSMAKGNNQNMDIDPNQMMMMGMQVYQYGKMLTGRSMSKADLKKMMAKWKSHYK